jgi:hypothetical protein
MTAVILDLAVIRERRDQQVRCLTDAILLKLAGVDISDHLELLAGMELFSEFLECA